MADSTSPSATPTQNFHPLSGLSDDQRLTLMNALTEQMAIYSGRGSKYSSLQTAFSKHDRYGLGSAPMNVENAGLTFITKPNFNMTTQSLRGDPILAMLDTMDPTSWMFGLRCLLDTTFSRSTQAAAIAKLSPWFNDTSPFNVLMSNQMLSIEGFPDFGIETETTESGMYTEDMTLARGSDWGRRSYDLNLTFRDLQGGPLMAYFYYWLVSMALQMDGAIVAYPDDREANRLNYTVSIYRFKLSPDLRTISGWCKLTGCLPLNVPIGASFNIAPGDPVARGSGTFSIPFRVNNVRYNDPRHLAAFNTLVKRYAEPSFPDDRIKVKVAAETNFTGLPYVDVTNGTNEMCWYALPEELQDPTVNIIAQIQSAVNAQIASLSKPTASS
jgi:hypothetical protein